MFGNTFTNNESKSVNVIKNNFCLFFKFDMEQIVGLELETYYILTC